MTQQPKQKKESQNVQPESTLKDVIERAARAKLDQPITFTLSEIEMRNHERSCTLEGENRILRSIVEGLLKINLSPKMELYNE